MKSGSSRISPANNINSKEDHLLIFLKVKKKKTKNQNSEKTRVIKTIIDYIFIM